VSPQQRRGYGRPRPSAAARHRPESRTVATPAEVDAPVVEESVVLDQPASVIEASRVESIAETTAEVIEPEPVVEVAVVEPEPVAVVEPEPEPAIVSDNDFDHADSHDDTLVAAAKFTPQVRRSGAIGTRVLGAARTATAKPVRAAASWNANMLEQADNGPRCGTRWGRGALTLAPSIAVCAGIGGAIAQGVLAASLNLNNQPFTLYSNKIQGTGLGLYLNSASTSGGANAAARVGIASATLDGLCGLVKQSMSLAGINKDVYLIITAGQTVTGTPNTTPTRVINASNLFLEASSLTGTTDVNNPATIQNAILGVSADNVQMPTGAGGAGQTMPTTSSFGSAAQPGGFGLQGSGLDANGQVVPGVVTIPGLSASAIDAEIAGNLTLPNVKIQIAVQNSGSAAPACPSTGF